MLISAVLGILVGVILGLTGAGGGILAVPALVAGMGWTMQQAVPVALIAVAGAAAIGAVDGFRRRLVRYKAAMLMAVSGIPLVSLGIFVAHGLPQPALLAIFAAVMVLVAIRLFLQTQHSNQNEDIGDSKIGRLNPATGRFTWSLPTAVLLAAIGALTGFMTGLLGIGGGFVIVPMLRRFTNVSLHGIVATSLLVIALVGTGGVVISVIQGKSIPLETAAFFTAATALGMLFGRKAASHLAPRLIQRAFSFVLVVAALALLVKAAISP